MEERQGSCVQYVRENGLNRVKGCGLEIIGRYNCDHMVGAYESKL